MPTHPRGRHLLDLDTPGAPEGLTYARRVLGDLRALKDEGISLVAIAREADLAHGTVWAAYLKPPRGCRIDILDALDGAIRRIRRNIEESANNPAG